MVFGFVLFFGKKAGGSRSTCKLNDVGIRKISTNEIKNIFSVKPNVVVGALLNLPS